MARNEMIVTVTGDFSYEAPAYGAPWKNETHYIWKMTDENGNIFIWKSTKHIGMYVRVPDAKCWNYEDKDGCPLDWVIARKGDKIKITGTIKAITHFNGEEETVLTRVKMLEKLYDAAADREAKKKAKEDAKKAAKASLMASIAEGDEIITMDYSRFKAHYSDCETVPDSYKEYIDSRGFETKKPTIDVVVRAGRMKNSGTRGRSFHTWIMNCVIDGKPACKKVYAISSDNAAKRIEKEFGATNIECVGTVHNSPRYID